MRLSRPLPSAFLLAALVLMGLVVANSATPSAAGPTFTVTKTQDTADGACDADCSVREAVVAANASPGPDTIFVPEGDYLLDLPGRNEDAGGTGDLDITDDVTLTGSGELSRIIGCVSTDLGCNAQDRILEIQSGVAISISDITLMHGSTSTCGACPPSEPGAGIYNKGILTLVYANIANNDGNGLANEGEAYVSDSRFERNAQAFGGGIANSGILTVERSVFVQNYAANFSGHGGAIYSDEPLSVSDSEFRDNGAGFVGGGVYSRADLTVFRSIFVDNNYGQGGFGSAISGAVGRLSVNESFFSGGGIQWDGELSITNSSVFAGNILRGFPLQAIDDPRPPGTITNVSVEGPIGNVAVGPLTIENVTAGSVYNNRPSGPKSLPAGTGPGDVSLRNSILTGPVGETNCEGPIISQGHNIDSGTSCGFSQQGDLSNVDPLVGPWSDYGGPYWTVSLLPGSPAIDAGDDAACPDADLRGISRPQDGDEDTTANCDIGSFEFCAGDSKVGVSRDACGADGPAVPDKIERANVSADGEQSSCPVFSYGSGLRECGRRPFLSADGKLLAFDSTAGNLVAGDVYECDIMWVADDTDCADVFVKNVDSGEVELISVDSTGNRVAADSSVSGMSRDGRFVMFTTTGKLVLEDDDSHADVYLRDRQLGITELISVNEVGAADPDYSFGGSISDDGRFVGWSNNGAASFIRDRQNGLNIVVSVDNNGNPGDDASGAPVLSFDGRYAAFTSRSALAPDDSNERFDVYVRDTVDGTTDQVSVTSDGSQTSYDSWLIGVSRDGRYVGIYSPSPLVPGSFGSNLFLRDRELNTVEPIDVPPTGVLATGTVPEGALANQLSISDDARFISFVTAAYNLFEGDNNLAYDVFVRDRSLGVTALVSRNVAGVQGNDSSQAVAMDATGRFVAFESVANNLVENDTNNAWDIFVVDRGDLPPAPTATATASSSVTVPPVTGTPSSTDTPQATPSPTPNNSTPTPTDNPDSDKQGDILCTGDNVGQDDLLFVLGFVGALNNGVTAGNCPDLGDVVALGTGANYAWGDVNCDGAVDEIDALFIVAHIAGVTLIPHDPLCLPVGQDSA